MEQLAEIKFLETQEPLDLETLKAKLSATGKFDGYFRIHDGVLLMIDEDADEGLEFYFSALGVEVCGEVYDVLNTKFNIKEAFQIAFPGAEVIDF